MITVAVCFFSAGTMIAALLAIVLFWEEYQETSARNTKLRVDQKMAGWI